MIHVGITYTVRSPHPSSAWTVIDEKSQRFADMDAAKDFLKHEYYYCKKRVPCYQDTKSRGTIQSGWIYCYKERENGKTSYRQDWVSVSDVSYKARDVTRAA